MMLHSAAKPGPEAITIAIAAHRGITNSEFRCFPLQNEAMHRSEKAQSECRVRRIVVMIMQNNTAHTLSPDILCYLTQQP